MTEGARCRSCGSENPPGRDFCENCGEYLAWAPTSMIAAVPESALAGDEATSSGPEEGGAAHGPPAAGDEPTRVLRPDDPEHEAGPQPDDGPEHEPREDAPHGAANGADPAGTVEQAPPPPPPPPPPAAREEAAAPAAEEDAGAANGAPPPAAKQRFAPPSMPGRRRAPKPRRPAPPSDAGHAPQPPTEVASAPGPPPPPLPREPEPELIGVPQSPPATGDASLVLAPLDPAVGAGGVPAVDAGATLTFRATIRNESQIVDNYDLTVLGLPENWAIVSPAAAFLVPLGSGRGDSELELRIDITAPRDYRSTAGIWTFELIALSRTHATVAARSIAQFEVRPFQAWSIEVVPTVNSGRFKARYRTAVRNDGNAEQMLWPLAIDDSNRLRTKFAFGRLTLDAGEVGADTLTVKPRLPKPVGRTIEHRVGVDVMGTEPELAEPELTAKEKLRAKAKEQAAGAKGKVKVGPQGVAIARPRIPTLAVLLKKFRPNPAMVSRLRSGPGDANAPVTARQIVFRQKPLIPLWLIGLILVLAIAALLLYLLLPQKTSVPTLRGVSNSFTAEKMLREKGLVLNQPVQERTDPNAEAGSVIEQSPAAGTEVEEGASVSIVVADGETKVDVPRLQGLTRVKADERLREEGLELGETQPADAPETHLVKSQIPDAGLSVDRGTSVRVFLAKAPTTAKAKKAAAKKKKAAAGAAAAGKKKAAENPTIPKIAGLAVGEYTEKLDKLGLEANVVRASASSKAGTVIAVVPAPGKKAKKGDRVTVRASSGPPPIAVQTATRIAVYNPVGAKQLFALPGAGAEPSYAANGEQIVYRSGSRIVAAATGKGAKPRTLYSGADSLLRPTVAPDSVTLAVIRREENDGDLCFGRVDVVDLGHLCLPDDGWDLDGRISWRKDGRAVLVGGRRQSDPSVFGVRVYRASRAFAQDPLLWRGSTATPTGKPGKGVRAAVFSPGGSKVAAVSNLDGDRFEVVLGEDETSLGDAESTGTKGCDVAWRADGQELATVQSDDGCDQPLGKVVRFAVGSPKETKTVASKGRNPAYRP